MIPVFVISLPDCHDRRATVSAALDGLGLPFQFADAVDGRGGGGVGGLPPERESEIDRTEARRRGNFLTDAEFACALSHIDVYRRIVADEIPYALVLEDDAVPRPDLGQFLAGRHYGGASLTQLVCHDRKAAYVRRSGAKRLFDGYGSYLRAPGFNLIGASGYVISFQAARHFIDGALPVTCVADWPDCVEALVARRECRIVHPFLVLHPDHGASLIERSRRQNNDRNKERRRVLGVYAPPFRRTVDAWKRAPMKPFRRRLHTDGT